MCWKCFQSIDFNCILLTVLLLFAVLIVFSSTVLFTLHGQFVSCATIAFSERYMGLFGFVNECFKKMHGIKVKVKVKITLEQAMKAQTGSRGIFLLFL